MLSTNPSGLQITKVGLVFFVCPSGQIDNIGLM